MERGGERDRERERDGGDPLSIQSAILNQKGYMYLLLTESRLMKLTHITVSTIPESIIEVEPYVLPHEESCPVSLLHSARTVNETISTIYTNIHYVHVHSETQAYNILRIILLRIVWIQWIDLPRIFERVVH